MFLLFNFLAGFEGISCEIDTDECQSSPCFNNATCIDVTDGYFCTCSLGFTGDQCEENIDDCRPGVCANGGTCVDIVNGLVLFSVYILLSQLITRQF